MKPMRIQVLETILWVAALSLTTGSLLAHDAKPVPRPKNLDEFLSSFKPLGWTIEKTQIISEKVGENRYVLFGTGGNIAVSIGDNGVLIVDDQFPVLMPKIKSAIGKIGGERECKGIDFAINTHWHFDHAEGNLALGPQGTWFVVQSSSREMMKQDHIIDLVFASYEQNAYPKEAWPHITFDKTMQFHFNGERIDLMQLRPRPHDG